VGSAPFFPYFSAIVVKALSPFLQYSFFPNISSREHPLKVRLTCFPFSARTIGVGSACIFPFAPSALCLSSYFLFFRAIRGVNLGSHPIFSSLTLHCSFTSLHPTLLFNLSDPMLQDAFPPRAFVRSKSDHPAVSFYRRSLVFFFFFFSRVLSTVPSPKFFFLSLDSFHPCFSKSFDSFFTPSTMYIFRDPPLYLFLCLDISASFPFLTFEVRPHPLQL